ncbi:hypothetical protein GGR42_000442 [Saonia flava]|uniref:Lipocalin-like domain-containing protein n=1 Tax=Saonia flava TaxID=523696 RepID=A0A846QSP6_9FLAO|nr:lipocalin family protein [Saonia flava]NJB69980.1 hypothetical protein [Saonia flava]
MKKSFLLFTIITSVLVASCSATKVARDAGNNLSGSWTLNSVSYEGSSGNFKSVIFNDADDICFEGSDWFFRDNNNTGRYTIQNSSLCAGGDRFIRWSVIDRTDAPDQLQFKFIDEKLKDISGGVGYRLEIQNLTSDAMTLKSKVSVEGEPISIVYNFTKKQ